jgi:hypothetical protein
MGSPAGAGAGTFPLVRELARGLEPLTARLQEVGTSSGTVRESPWPGEPSARALSSAAIGCRRCRQPLPSRRLLQPQLALLPIPRARGSRWRHALALLGDQVLNSVDLFVAKQFSNQLPSFS